MNSVKAHDRRPHKFSCDSSGIVAIAIKVFEKISVKAHDMGTHQFSCEIFQIAVIAIKHFVRQEPSKII